MPGAFTEDRMSTITQPLALSRSSFATLARDYSELVKARVTSLIVLTAWTGFYFGAAKSGVSSLSWTLFHALLGVGLVSCGAAAFNELIEHETDGRMRRTAGRPLVTRRMSLAHGAFVGMLMTAGGSMYLALACNPLTGALAFATALAYLAAYTPLKKVHPVSTLIGAVPGAMPPVLGWTAARGRLDWEAMVLFAILFSGKSPISIPSHGSSGKITRTPAFACCRW